MDCTQARNLLSEYADGALDKETTADLEGHLSSCAECRKEVTALQSLIQDLRSLPLVEPPTDFLQQLHGRMEKPSRFKQTIGKLFFPVRFKIPLQLAGAALAALLVFSVFTLQQEEFKVAETPPVLKREEKDEKRQVTRADKAAAPAEQSAAKVSGLKKEERLIELTLVLGRTAPGAQEGVPAPTQAFGGKSTEKVLQAPRAALQTAPAEQAEKVEVRKMIEAGQGRILSAENEKEQPSLIFVEVPADKLPSLVDSLRRLGKVHVSPSIPSDETHGPVKIRLRIVESD